MCRSLSSPLGAAAVVGWSHGDAHGAGSRLRLHWFSMPASALVVPVPGGHCHLLVTET